MNKGKKIVTVALAACMTTSVALIAAGCNDRPETRVGQFTYTSATTSLSTNWNPHTWETNADSAILDYLSSPFVTMSILDSEAGTYQWVYEMATSVEDVTAAHQSDLTKYGVTLQEGQTAASATEGYVYEIKLNEDAAWQDGTPITADDYIYSMQQLLNPAMKNYRANLYIAGESALAGARGYYYNGELAWLDNSANAAYTRDSLVKGSDGIYTTSEGEALVIATNEALEWLGGYSLATYVSTYGSAYFGVESYNQLVALADSNGRVSVTDESLALLEGVITAVPAWGESSADVVNYMLYQYQFPEVTYDSVGCYKVDDYTIRYVNQTYINLDYFMTSLTSTWLVYEDLYEAGKDTTGELTTTNYGTSMATTMSYGPYKFVSIDEGRQMRLTQNEHWYGWETYTVDDVDYLVSYTNFEVDGERRQQYMTTDIVINVMDTATMEQAFMRGEISDWSPASDQVSQYAMSDYLYQIDETYTMSFFFNTDLEKLQEMDASGRNTNGVVLTNTNFRKAMSLAINREEYVQSTPGYKPAYSLMNDLYFYNVYEDPESRYRDTDEAMQAICNLYGVEYGAGTAYATLEEAYNSINGYNLTEAQALMKTACEELVAAGLYTAGEPISIAIAWKQGTINSDDQAQLALLNRYINAAAEGSGFGTITFSQTGNMQSPDPYDAVPQGVYAIGQGAWGGAAFYPFRNFQVYMDPDQYEINEAACWDPTTETLTLTVDGEEVTMTWQEWSNSMTGAGRYSAASNELKLNITAQLEEAYLRLYYRIPLSSTTQCFLLSQQLSYYTQTYNIMYDFGGFRLMSYNYTDSEWDAYVDEQGGTLSYV